MSFTALTFSTLEVLSSTKMTQLYGNTYYFKSEAAAPSGAWAPTGAWVPTGAWTFTPGSAIVPITIDQNTEESGLFIDSEATGGAFAGLYILGKQCAYIAQDISNGYGLRVNRNIAEAGANPLALFAEYNASSTQPTVQMDGAGTTSTLTLNATGVVAAHPVLRVFHDGNSVNAYGIDITCGMDAPDVNSNFPLTFSDGDGGLVGSVSFNNTGTQFNTSSDRRLKKNIKDTSLNGIGTIKKLRIREFDFRKTNAHAIGLIAQEVQKIYPLAVTKPNNKKKEHWAISYDKFTVPLMKAFQEQQAIIENLKSRIGKLEKK